MKSGAVIKAEDADVSRTDSVVSLFQRRTDGQENQIDDSDLEYEENPFIYIEQQGAVVQLLSLQHRRPLSPFFPQFQSTPFLDVFLERFIDDFAPDASDAYGTSSAIRKAGSARMFSPLLNEAFHAVTMAHFGQSTGSWEVRSQGFKSYQKTLQRLQKALFDPVQSRASGVLATVILLMAYESLQHTSERALIAHCMGALKLIEFRNPWNHMFGVEHLCFVELLPYWVCTAIVMRKPTFLARKEWKTVPWSAPGCYKDIMALLLEQVVDLPAVLWRHDRYKLALQTNSNPPNELGAQLSRLWAAITALEAQLHSWKCAWADTYASGQPREDFSHDPDFPLFQYTLPNTSNPVTPPLIVYPDPQLCRTLCTYYTAMLMLSSVDTRPLERISEVDILNYARLICRSMGYYIRTVPGNMINRMAFPLRVAYDFFPTDGLERRFVEAVFQLVARKNALRAWGKFMPDISAKAVS